ncbi:MAG TPA: alpha-glucosidase C-terminal domain-containing protein, partial [Longimicrobiaceae bacterium]|nr:alpha-glucosidase C-terminal domain-containing protein [Longimicrobiaceae bacterium]
LRLDAVHYLIEREGTNNQGLPETHEILKKMRAEMDARYKNRLFLAEANECPEDLLPYFGAGDECHMAFHFPLMPRVYMAIAQEDRHPIVDIVHQTPEIPDTCQWAIFLRNHDELTLEMVTDEERDYMYSQYAEDARMRINLGIRRRLSPLMENDRRKIELLNSILFTMPGSPIIYYGDEIGMGDNIWLGDRDGVRTPMQWTPDRNAAFSRAESARLYAPVINDSVYGHQSINVEAQEKSPFSLLNWMKRLVQVRKQHHAFGRGSIEFLQPENPHVLAYLREHGNDSILVVNNLSGTAQAVRLDLARFAGCVPVEMLGHTEFLPIDETPYALTLSPYGFFWFAIRPRAAGDDPGEVDESLAREWAEQDMRVLESRESVAALVGAIPSEWLAAQRWFRGKGREVVAVELRDHAVVAPEHGPRWMMGVVQVRFAAGEPDTYLLPLSLRPPLERGVAAEAVATVAMESGEVRLYEALVDRYTALALLRTLREEEALPSATGRFRGHRVQGAVPEGEHGRLTPVKRMSAEQSNTSIVFGERLIMKLFRKLEAGVNPDLDVTRFLVENTEFRGVPALAGWLDYTGEGVANASVAGVFRFIPNSGDAWAYTRRALDRFFAAASRSAADPSTPAGQDATRRMMGDFHAAARSLGRVTGELHAALASAGPEHPDFAPELVTEDDVRGWTDAYRRDVAATLGEVGRR